MGEDAQGLTVAVFPFEAVVKLLAFREMSEDGNGRLTECPLEMYVADFGPGRTDPLAGRRGFAFDEASIGSESLNGLEATDVVDIVEEGEGEDLPDAGDGVKAEQGVGIVRPSLSEDTVLQIPNETIVGLTEGQVRLDALPNNGVREGAGNGRTLDLVDQRPLGPGQIVLVEGVLDVGHEFAPLSGEMQATAKQVPGGPHLGRVSIGLGQKASTQKAGGRMEGSDGARCCLWRSERTDRECGHEGRSRRNADARQCRIAWVPSWVWM